MHLPLYDTNRGQQLENLTPTTTYLRDKSLNNTRLTAVPMPPCKFYQKGHCLFGAACKNSHEAVALPWAPPNSPPPFQTTCHFFSRGICTFGAKCRNSHDVEIGLGTSWTSKTPSQDQRLKPETPDFQPAMKDTTKSSNILQSVNCIYFSRGFCRNGQLCPFRHEAQNTNTLQAPSAKAVSYETVLVNTLGKLTMASSYQKEFNGAVVNFEGGAEVSSVKLASDFSTIQITGLPANAGKESVMSVLSKLGSSLDEGTISIKDLGNDTSIAEVKVESGTFAKDTVSKFESLHERVLDNKIGIKAVIEAARSGGLGNRLQLGTVTCSWHQSSRPAWLIYQTSSEARYAKLSLEKSVILGRVPECTIEEPRGFRASRSCTLQLGNLHQRTTTADIREKLPRHHKLARITLGDPSHDCSDEETNQIIETLLRSKGELESFQMSPTQKGSRMKATANFLEREKAMEAVRSLNDTRVPSLGNSKLFVSQVISVKYNVCIGITTVLKKELEQLTSTVWENGHVRLKIYPQIDPQKSFTALRLFGEDLKNVSKAKIELEKLLAGDVIMDQDGPLWNPNFFKPEALADLNKLAATQKVYIYRDARKCQLVLYGGSEASRVDVQRILKENVDATRIALTPELLKYAMEGGMKRLKAEFGNAVTLNLSAVPKTISIAGTPEDLQRAYRLLNNESNSDRTPRLLEDTQDCVVCWTEATDPLETSCGHVYCNECFANQASSAGDGILPVTCFGSDGCCKHIFTIDELRTMLPFTMFEDLLRKSFDTYIRKHPKDFQYCPTPDCPQVYRITETGETFFCSSCLTPICTACNVINHDGMTCAEYKDISSSGDKAFKKWKEENDGRDCPRCKTTIVKSEGCNHMECTRCSAHICWFCMKVYDTSGECYSHMQKSHGNIYDR